MFKSIPGNARYILTGFLFFIAQIVSGQDQNIADSLAAIYHNDILEDSAKLELLKNLSYNEMRDLNRGLQYAEELISLAKKKGSDRYLHIGYFQKGNKERLQGNLQEALDDYLKSVEAARKAKDTIGIGNAYGAIADNYSISRDHVNAMLYYNKSIHILRKTNDSINLASAISNAGDEYLNDKNYDSALLYFTESEIIFKKVHYSIGMAYCMGNIGMVYAGTGKRELAEKNINDALQILEAAQNYYPISVYLISMADIYQQKGDISTALVYAKRSLALAKLYGLKEQIGDANRELSDLYNAKGQPAKSLLFYKNYIVYLDSVNNIRSVQKMADLRRNYEISQKQIEVDLLNQEKRNQRIMVISLFIILGLTAILLTTLYWYYRSISREKKRSEALLLNILPAETAKELKLSGKVDAVRFNEVTVVFTDFIEFSKSAEQVEPEQLVRSLGFYFKAFDEITTKYGLEKIKTIGDSYMCASGLPTATKSHAVNAILAAKEMTDLVKTELSAPDGITHFEIRIGIHTGPVVAGIVGIKKWQYDIWGDTVNIASRMESASKPGRINLSESTYQIIKDEFPCEYRGEIEVKNLGCLKMYFLSY
jgi:class 3 adenylate cyclase